MTRRQKLLQDYLFELVFAQQLKLNGTTVVDTGTSPNQQLMPIDECIAHWQKGVDELSNDDIPTNKELIERWDY